LDQALIDGVAAPEVPELTLADGYTVQDHWARLREGRGDERVGFKIGLTTPEARRPWGAVVPGRGILFSSVVKSSPAVIPTAPCFTGFELELAVRLSAEVRATDSRESVRSKLGWAGLGIEVIGTRWSVPTRSLGAWAADNGMAAAAVLGAGCNSIALLSELLEADFALETDATTRAGAASRTLNDALDSVLWLAQDREAKGGRLEAGSLILTGSIVGPVPTPEHGGRLVARLGGFEPVEVRFDPSDGGAAPGGRG